MSLPHFALITGWATPVSTLDRLTAPLAAAGLADVDRYDFHGAHEEAQITDGPSSYAKAIMAELPSDDRPLLLAGWSTGALIALEIAAAWPDRVAGLVLISGTACFCAQPDYDAGVPPRIVKAMQRRLPRQPEDMLSEFFMQATAPEPLPDANRKGLVHDALKLGAPALAAGLSYLRRTDCRHVLTAIRAPVLLLHGQADAIVPVAAAHYLEATLPNARLHEIANGSHALPLLAPERLVGHIVAFANTIDS